jgi:tetratricopeptide (TPR) repeat protein
MRQAQLEPLRADIRYLLGAQWATAGRYDLAIEEMTRALLLDPSLNTARLQLGLLHLTSGRPAEAVNAWSALDSLSEADPLRVFKQGLEALIRDDFTACVELLSAGIRLNQANTALNKDMSLVIDRVRPHLRDQRAPGDESSSDAVRTDFSLYNPKKH